MEAKPSAAPPLEQWLWPFLRTEYYKCCATHEHMNNKNSRCNFFCIHCTGPICEYCRNSRRHDGHRILQIRRASNACSVDTASIECLIDTSGLHKFKINGYSIHFLVSRPSEGSKKKAPSRDDSLCDFCRWTLPGGVTQGSRFCSIYCKLPYKSSCNSPLLAFSGGSGFRGMQIDGNCAGAVDRPSCKDVAEQYSKPPTEGDLGAGGHCKKRARSEVGRDRPSCPKTNRAKPALENTNVEEEEKEKEKKGDQEESKIMGLPRDYPAGVGSHGCSRVRKRKGVPHRSPLF